MPTDVGEKLFCIVTAHNAYGSGVAHSNVVGPVVGPTGGIDSPLDLPGLVGWYDATVGVYSDAGITPITDGQTVVQWNDQSGLGHTLTGGASKPIYDTTGFNGLPGLVFTPSQVIGNSTEIFVRGAGANFSAFVVCQMLTGTELYGRLIAYVGTGQSDDSNNAGSASLLLRSLSANAVGGYRVAPTATSAISLATNYRLGSIFDGSNHTIYVNNVEGTPVASTGTFTSPGRVFVGGPAAFWSGAVAEVVITNTALDVTMRTDLDNYFKTKWGLS